MLRPDSSTSSSESARQLPPETLLEFLLGSYCCAQVKPMRTDNTQVYCVQRCDVSHWRFSDKLDPAPSLRELFCSWSSFLNFISQGKVLLSPFDRWGKLRLRKITWLDPGPVVTHVCLTQSPPIASVWSMGLVCVCLCLCLRRVCPHTPRMEKHLCLKSDGLWGEVEVQVRLPRWTGTSMCVNIGVFGYVSTAFRGFVGVLGRGLMCIWVGGVCVGGTEWDISVGVCFFLCRVWILYLLKEIFKKILNQR